MLSYAECITSSSALVDGFLKPQGLTVPALVPQLIKDATKFFAAWMFRRFSDPWVPKHSGSRQTGSYDWLQVTLKFRIMWEMLCYDRVSGLHVRLRV